MAPPGTDGPAARPVSRQRRPPTTDQSRQPGITVTPRQPTCALGWPNSGYTASVTCRRPELAHLVRNVRRTARLGAHVGVRRQVPRGFPVFCCRGGRCGPAVTGAVLPLLPAAGLPIRLRPGPPGGDPRPAPLHGPGHPGDIDHGLRGFDGDREHRQPPRPAQAPPHADDHPRDSGSKPVLGGVRGLEQGGDPR